MPPQLGRRPPLDGLRGVAIVLVLLVHAGSELWRDADWWLAPGGALGVHLFFVLSGFLITTVLLSERERTGRIDLGRFAGRRARRLVPVLVVLVVTLAVDATLSTRLELRSVGWTAVHVLTFTTNQAVNGHPLPFVGALGGEPTVLSDVLHTWSLAIEVQFYVLWAVVLWAAARARWSHGRLAVLAVVSVAVVAGARAVAFARGTTWVELYFATFARLDAPLVGSAVGVAFVAGWLRSPPRWLAVAGAGGAVGLVVAAFATETSDGMLPAGLYTVLAAGVALAIADVVSRPGGRLARALSWRPLVLLGVMSYSLYLWHFPIFLMVRRDLPDVHGAVRTLIGLGAALAVATLSYVAVERPFLRRRPVVHVGPAVGVPAEPS